MKSNKKIIRVFPRRTSCTPIDIYSYCGPPDLFIPDHDEIHISVTFTWDIAAGRQLADTWRAYSKKPVKINGPAYGPAGGEFTPGLYLKPGITITSRGCPGKCKYCFVPTREGPIRELKIKPGHIIQDNNLLACSKKHIDRVFTMLKKQKDIVFSGGLDSRKINNALADRLAGLKIGSIFLAADHASDMPAALRAIDTLRRRGFPRDKIRVYALIGNDYMENLARLIEIFRAGALPFAQPYQPAKKFGYPLEWRRLVKIWSRPAMYKKFVDQLKPIKF